MNARKSVGSFSPKDIDLLIIGGDSNLSRNFIKQTSSKFRMFCISRFATGYPSEIVCEDFFKVPEEYFQRSSRVINFVGITHAFHNIPEKDYLRINGELPIALAKMSKSCGVRYFIQMSTLAVFGRQTHIRPDSLPSPETAYGRSKLIADIGIKTLQDSDFLTLSLRPPMVCGPHAPGNLSRLISLSDTILPLPFDGINNKRDFLYIDNFVSILDEVFREEPVGELVVNENDAVSTTYIVKTLRDALGRKDQLFKLGSMLHFALSKFFPSEYDKIFSDSYIDPSCVPDFLKKIPFLSKDHGLRLVADAYLQKKKEHTHK